MEVLSTTNYNIFGSVVGNRRLIPSHVRSLERAVEEDNLLHANPIIVDEEMRVIDGQHRLEVAKRLGVPIFYIVTRVDSGVIPQINTARRNWTTKDYINYCAELGVQDYKALRTIMNMTDIHPSIVLEAGNLNRGEIARGKLKLTPGDARMLLDRLEKLQDYVDTDPSLGSARMLRAFIRLMEEGMYKHSTMLKKLKSRKGTIKTYDRLEDNMRELEDVYNYWTKTRERIF